MSPPPRLWIDQKIVLLLQKKIVLHDLPKAMAKLHKAIVPIPPFVYNKDVFFILKFKAAMFIGFFFPSFN